jgi:hypothetical protein
MFREWVRCPEKCVRKAVIVMLVGGMVNLSVPAAFARQIPTERMASNVSTADVMMALPVISLADDASRQLREALERSMTTEARRLAMAGQGSSTSEKSSEKSGHWCAGGLALLAGGVAAAVASGVRRDYNAQKPSPPVGVVLGTTAAAVGAIRMIKACK